MESKVMGQQHDTYSRKCARGIGFGEVSYPTHDIIKVCQMSLASLTTKDLIGSQVDVV